MAPRRFTVLLMLVIIAVLALSRASFAQEDEEQIPDGGMYAEPEEPEVDPASPDVVRDFVVPEDGPFPYVYLLSENSCKLRRKFRGVRAFIQDEAPYYQKLKVKLVGGEPRLHAFKSKTDYENFVVDSTNSVERMLEMLENLKQDPDYYNPKHPNVEIPLSWETTVEDLTAVLEKLNNAKGTVFDKGLLVDIFDDDTDRGGPGAFNHDEVLTEEQKAQVAKNKEQIQALVEDQDNKEAAAAFAKADGAAGADKTEL